MDDVQVQQTVVSTTPVAAGPVAGECLVAEPVKTVSKTSFVREVFSDDGSPSSSRILTFILSLVTLGIVVGVMRHVCGLKDASTLGLWLTSIPAIIMSLIGLSAAPYAINRSTNSISDVIASLKR